MYVHTGWQGIHKLWIMRFDYFEGLLPFFTLNFQNLLPNSFLSSLNALATVLSVCMCIYMYINIIQT